jgi:hypothetical protein
MVRVGGPPTPSLHPDKPHRTLRHPATSRRPCSSCIVLTLANRQKAKRHPKHPTAEKHPTKVYLVLQRRMENQGVGCPSWMSLELG